MHTEKTLSSLGLTSNNIKVYQALITLNTASITQIAEKTHIQRPVVYASIEKLHKLGLIAHVLMGKRRHWSVEHPRNLMNIVEAKKAELTAILPQLEQEYQENVHEPRIRYYSGTQGLNTALEEILHSGTTTLYSMGPSIIVNEYQRQLKSFWQKRMQKKIEVKRLISLKEKETHTTHPLFTEIENIKALRELRVAPEGFTFDMYVIITNDTVYYIAPKKEKRYILSIQSESHHAMMLSMFKTIWNLSQSLYK